MTKAKTADSESPPAAEHHVRKGAVALDAAMGAAAGAMVGVAGGPAGMAVGAIIGGAIGAAAGEAQEMEALEGAVWDEQLDREIGVTEGSLGEAAPNQPPVKIGAFHTASMGVGVEPATPSSEGAIQNVDGD